MSCPQYFNTDIYNTSSTYPSDICLGLEISTTPPDRIDTNEIYCLGLDPTTYEQLSLQEWKDYWNNINQDHVSCQEMFYNKIYGYDNPESTIGYNQTGLYFNYQQQQSNQYNNSQVLPSLFGDEITAQEMMEFKKKGDAAMMMDIRSFVAKYNIRQQMIAEMTHISQGYISTFFHGEKMSEKRKNII